MSGKRFVIGFVSWFATRCSGLVARSAQLTAWYLWLLTRHDPGLRRDMVAYLHALEVQYAREAAGERFI